MWLPGGRRIRGPAWKSPVSTICFFLLSLAFAFVADCPYTFESFFGIYLCLCSLFRSVGVPQWEWNLLFPTSIEDRNYRGIAYSVESASICQKYINISIFSSTVSLPLF